MSSARHPVVEHRSALVQRPHSDNVFSDGYSLQLATVTGSVADGYRATLNVPV